MAESPAGRRSEACSLWRALRAVLLLASGLACLSATARAADAVGSPAAQPWTAERLYREGLRSDGKPLEGLRTAGTALLGADAACVNCHRRSGLGTSEGKTVIPPIAGDYLFRARITNATQIDRLPTSNTQQRRAPYTDETLARALREGIGSDGQPLSVLMPRYALDQHDFTALLGYLRSLGNGAVPGVSEDTLHFATIITPDADPIAREGMLATLEQFFHDRNHIIAGVARPLQHTDQGVMYRVTRSWKLHVWELSGPPSSWTGQLRQRQAAEPVFAVVSGLGGATWAPVHEFCETSHLPCLFPNTDVPVVRESDFYTSYFSRGVLLEAALLGDALLQPDPAAATPAAAPEQGGAATAAAGSGGAPRTRRLVQVLRAGSAGAPAASALAAHLQSAGWQVETRELAPQDGGAALARAVAVDASTQLLLWLAPGDLAALPARPPAAAQIWLSGLLGGLERAPLPADWLPLVELTYPLELPDRRAVAMKLPEGWFRIKQVELKDARIQFQTYLACQILSESVGEVHISFLPDYLLERLESMLSHRRFNAMYPRLSLGVNQRFASKGGYLVRFGAAQSLIVDGDWRIPGAL